MVDARVLEAVSRLNRDSDFRVFMEEVQRRRDAARDILEQAIDPWIAGRAQGASILAGELIQLANEAQGALSKRQHR